MNKNYIEFYYEEEGNFVAKIHKEGKYKNVKNPKNVEKLIEICKKHGYLVDREGFIDKKALAIAKEFDEYMARKKKIKKLNIVGQIVNNMKLNRKNTTLGKTLIASTLAITIAAMGVNSLKENRALPETDSTLHQKITSEEDIQEYFDRENLPDEQIIPADTVFLENPEENQEEIPIQTEDDAQEYFDRENLPDEQIIPANTVFLENPEENQEEIPVQTEEQLQEMLQQNEFHFSYEDRTQEENLGNAKRYEYLFEKYANRYGLDKNLLMAIAAQESCGDHYSHLGNGPAEGIMQIEKSVYLRMGFNDVNAYNFETGEMDKIYVTEEKLQDLETNIQIGAMILRTSLENNYYNVPLALQAYNFGPGNINKVLAMCSDLENIQEESLRKNPTNNVWLQYRAFLGVGDPEYVEFYGK